jgi:hypothetical protein
MLIGSLPQIRDNVKQNMASNLLAHSSQLVANRLKTTVKKLLWEKLGGVAKEMLLTKDGECVDEFNKSQLTEISIIKKHTLNTWFMLTFSSGV